MDKLTEGERLVALETKMDTVLANQSRQADDFKVLNNNLNLLLPTYATKADFEALKKRSAFQTWLVGTLSAGFGAVLAILIQSYLSK
jgi:hypothetical protein